MKCKDQDIDLFTQNDKMDNDKMFEQLFFDKNPKQFVLPINPIKINNRLSIQQGLFLCPGDVSKPFEDNLIEMIKDDSEKNDQEKDNKEKSDQEKDNKEKSDQGKNDKIIKLTLKFDLEEVKRTLKYLHQMNINKQTLFPGLEGFAKSLKTHIAFPELFDPGQI